MSAAQAQTREDDKKVKDRSPAFPFISLKVAIERAKEFYNEEKRNSAPVPVAIEHWGYGQKSSGGLQTIAALKYFGLLNDSGNGDARKVQLSELGLRIVMDQRPVSPDRDALLKKAALLPKAYARLWNEWGSSMPSGENVRHHLRVELKFSDSTVDSFIRGYKDTIAFAKLYESDRVSPEVEDNVGPEDVKYVPQVGDYVQWEARGVLQFPEPKRVAGLSSDGGFAFFEGSQTGVPVGELKKEEAPAPNLLTTNLFRPTQKTNNVQEDVYSIPEGRIIVQWPASLSAESVAEVKEYLKLLERKIERSKSKDAAE